MGISLDQIVPWGRTRREYEGMFHLTQEDLAAGVLDCGGGPASFTAELHATGTVACAVDPVYAYPGKAIRARFEAAVEPMLAQVRATPDDWVWSFHKDPEDLLANRRAAMDRFLADYDSGLAQGRYRVGQLPSLPLPDNMFGLAVCSHLLFLYSELLSAEFHVRAVFELCRVTRDVRIFPLLTLAGLPSPHLAPVCAATKAAGWQSEVVKVDYELQRGGNRMLRLFRR